MENEVQRLTPYGFLNDDRVEQHFADINLLLLSGKHIDERYYAAYTVLDDKPEEWTLFYKNLYGLNLVAESFDGHRCYYLDFFDSSKGTFTDRSRHRELSEMNTLVGLMLLDLYYKRFFDERKLVRWTDLKKVILEGEQQEAYKRILFNEVRDSNAYDLREWGNVIRKFNHTIDLFDKIGWVEKKVPSQGDVPDFEIRPAINRLAKMYENELHDFDAFVGNLKNADTL